MKAKEPLCVCFMQIVTVIVVIFLMPYVTYATGDLLPVLARQEDREE